MILLCRSSMHRIPVRLHLKEVEEVEDLGDALSTMPLPPATRQLLLPPRSSPMRPKSETSASTYVMSVIPTNRRPASRRGLSTSIGSNAITALVGIIRCVWD